MKKILCAVKNKVLSVKNSVVLVGSGITAGLLLFAIANVFVDFLGMYVGLLVGFLIFTEIKNWINGNKGDC